MKPAIISAVIKVGNKQFEAANHADAIKKAMQAGENVSRVSRWNDGYFKTTNGTIINRKKAMTDFGINTSERIPTQFGKPPLPTTPDPRRKR